MIVCKGVHAVMQITYHATARNTTVRVFSHDILMNFRFSAHHNLRETHKGITTFTETAWLNDYRCMVEVSPGCALKHPDFLIFTSGE